MGDFFMKRDLTVIGVYIAAVIGAGFASGAEIVNYFAKYNKLGIFGILVSAILFGLMAGLILDISKENECYNFGEFMRAVFPKRIADILNAVITIFMVCVFAAMVAGSGEAISELFGRGNIIGVLSVLILTAAVLAFDVRGFMAANGIMAVIIIFGIIGVCFYLLNFREINVFKNNSEWVSAGVVYTGYNILTAGAVLPALGRYTKNIKRVGILSALIIFLLLLALWGIISIYYNKIPLGTIPMITICKRHGIGLSAVYSVVLFAAMLTTALANGFALFDIFKGNKYIKIAFIVSIGFFMSGLSFDFFVDIIYRCAGYAGSFFMFFIIIKNKIVRNMKKKNVK